jgi:hypothetical protein
LKNIEEDEYASYGGQKAGCNRWKSCPHDEAEWTSELQGELINGRKVNSWMKVAQAGILPLQG